jgi:YidC/Oxa1 family membrane protein insertase
MDKNDKMHPEDMRNLLIFGALSIVLWLSYDHFILKPKITKMKAAQIVAEVNSQQNLQSEDLIELPRGEVLDETSKRLNIDNEFVTGSINLKGGRLDDITLKNYYKTVEKKENISVLSPLKTAHPRFVEYGWVAQDGATKVPSKETQWQGSGRLTQDTPVTLSWNNGKGLTFKRTISLNEDYGFSVRQSIVNNSSKSVTLFPYALATQKGMPEGFEGRWIVHEGPISYAGGDLYDPSYKKLKKEPKHEAKAAEGWIGFVDKYWLTALVPAEAEDLTFRINHVGSTIEDVKKHYQVDIMGQGRNIAAGETAEFKTNLFVGAKKLNLLGKYEKEWNVKHFDLAVDFGLFYFLTRPFFWVINFFYGLVGNFGVAIIMFTVVLRLAVFPLANTSFRSFARMREIGPQMTEMREKFKDDKQAMQQELVKLYQKEKVNPMAGCLPILIQIPIFFSLFKVLSNTIEMRHAPFFGWIQDLSAPDPTTVFNFFGAIPWSPPLMLMVGAWPCLMLVTMIAQRQLSPPPPDKMQAQMIALMPWVMTFILAKFAAGLVIYWTFNNLFSVIQQYVIMRGMGVEVHFFNKKKTKEAADEKEAAAKLAIEAKKEALKAEMVEKPKKPVSKPKPKKKTKKK